jgi:hypothetical protein
MGGVYRDELTFGFAACAAPAPVLRALAKAGADGVFEHVDSRVGEVLLRLDDPGGEAIAEEVPTPAATLVEALGIPAVEDANAL